MPFRRAAMQLAGLIGLQLAERGLDEQGSVLMLAIPVVVAVPAERCPELIRSLAQRQQTTTGVKVCEAAYDLRSDAQSPVRLGHFQELDLKRLLPEFRGADVLAPLKGLVQLDPSYLGVIE